MAPVSDDPHAITSERLMDFAIASIATAGLIYAGTRARKRLRRIPTAEHVTPEMLAAQKTLKGICVKVSDADGMRIYHTPWPAVFRRLPDLGSRGISNRTIHLRIAGVDAPEMSHFGKPAMPFSDEAYQHLRSLAEGRKVKAKLLRRDQYGRIVSHITVRKFPWLWRTSISHSLASAGLASLYTGQGAEYGDDATKKKLEAAIAAAKKSRKGMWSQTKEAYESPAEYKRRIRAEPASTTAQ